MTLLYVTADTIGAASGGGLVTRHESEALREVGSARVLDRAYYDACPQGYLDVSDGREPWKYDNWSRYNFYTGFIRGDMPRLAHFYAGTWSKTIEVLKAHSCKVTYTAAAHDVALSRREHEALGLPYDYPHLIDPDQWQRYLAGYQAADVLICPSQHSANVMRGFGCTQRIEVIPHGVDLPAPEAVRPAPAIFTLGYLGAVGPDKGLRYLLQAWKRLAYKDAVLVLAGRDSTSPFVRQLYDQFGGGNVHFRGWVNSVTDFYNSISAYCQPSVTEGFGIEVIEALAHRRPVLCSTGAGAADVVPQVCRYEATDVDALCDLIDSMKQSAELLTLSCRQERIAPYTWDKVRARYQGVWKELLSCPAN